MKSVPKTPKQANKAGLGGKSASTKPVKAKKDGGIGKDKAKTTAKVGNGEEPQYACKSKVGKVAQKKQKLTPQRERFAQCLASGMTQADAYRTAYPTSLKWPESSVWSHASTLAANGKVVERVGELKRPAIEAVKLSKQWVLDRLISVAERCRQAEPVLDKKGNPVFAEDENGKLRPAFTFNAQGANRALELLGKEQGMFVERSEVGKPGDFAEWTDDQLTRAAADADAAIARLAGTEFEDKARDPATARTK